MRQADEDLAPRSTNQEGSSACAIANLHVLRGIIHRQSLALTSLMVGKLNAWLLLIIKPKVTYGK